VFNCPECNYGLTFVDSYFRVGFKCERCLISKLQDNRSKPDVSKEKLYSQFKEHCKNPDVSEKKYILPEKDTAAPEEDTAAPIEDTISTEDRKTQLQNTKINFSVENKFINDSLPSNTNPDRSESFPEILKFVESSIKSGKKYIVVNAPTGIGKSHVAATLCKFLKQGVILTKQTSLQLQYVRQFPWMNQVKGMSNFLCPAHEWDKTANFGNCDGCNFRCDKDDFEIINKGTEKETVSINPGSKFGGLSTEILHNVKDLDTVPEEEKTIIAAERLTPDERVQQEEQEELLRRFIIKYKNQFFFVLPEDKIPEASEVQRNGGQLQIPTTEICPYYQQRIMGEMGSFAVYNYSMYVSTMLGKNIDSEKTKARQILICDEAHSLEDILKEQGSIRLSLKSISDLIDNKTLLDEIIRNTSQKETMKLISNLEQLLEILEGKYRDISKHRDCIQFLNSKMHIDKHRREYCQKHKRTIKKCEDCSKLRKEVDGGQFLGCKRSLCNSNINCKENHIKFTATYTNQIRKERKNLKSGLSIIKKIHEKFKDPEHNFVLQLDKNEINIQPIRVSETAQTLFSNFSHVVFLSSTIHEEIFVNDMGIRDYAFASFPNPIERHNRIVKMDTSNLQSYDSDKYPEKVNGQYEVIAKKIIIILQNHKDQKGLILVNSKKDLRNILPFLDKFKSRLTYNPKDAVTSHTNLKPIELLKIHESKEHSVLFSSAMWEGIDLKGKSGEFCIIATAPFMPIAEKSNPYGHAKNRLRGNQEWSKMQNAFKFVQGMGRCVRGPGPEERATTYVLDENCQKHRNWLEMYIKKDINFKWFTDSME
jgi:Rad3-related DNA helicase